jgi:hypothetical protein
LDHFVSGGPERDAKTAYPRVPQAGDDVAGLNPSMRIRLCENPAAPAGMRLDLFLGEVVTRRRACVPEGIAQGDISFIYQCLDPPSRRWRLDHARVGGFPPRFGFLTSTL